MVFVIFIAVLAIIVVLGVVAPLHLERVMGVMHEEIVQGAGFICRLFF